MTQAILEFTESATRSHVESRQSQSHKILEYLLAGHRLSPLLALEKFGCFRLGGRVYDLKKEGWDIQSEMITLPSGKRVAQYWLPRPPSNSGYHAESNTVGNNKCLTMSDTVSTAKQGVLTDD